MNVKIELVSRVEEFTGRQSWFIQINGKYQFGSMTFNIVDADASYANAVELATKFPKTVETVVKSLEVKS